MEDYKPHGGENSGEPTSVAEDTTARVGAKGIGTLTVNSFDVELSDLIKKWVERGETYPTLIEAMKSEIKYLRSKPRAYAQDYKDCP